MNHKLLTAVFICTTAFLKAQMMNINLKNGNVISHPVSEVLSIKFTSNDMVVRKISGSEVMYAISDINFYAFSTSSGVGLEELPSDVNVNVYPNPSNGLVNVKVDGVVGELKISLVDVNGKEVSLIFDGMQSSLSATYTHQIDYRSLASGIYTCVVRSEKGRFESKVIVR
jgi:hypothetical protein